MIEVENLTKQFGSKRAVDDLTFTVKKGEVLGFLGPNGAGKSTTMRMITGFIPPTSGDARVCGISVIDEPKKAKTKIGYLPESAPLYHDMTVIGFLKFCASVRGLSGTAKNDAVERALACDRNDREVRRLGQRGDVRIGLQPLDFRAIGVDRVISR